MKNRHDAVVCDTHLKSDVQMMFCFWLMELFDCSRSKSQTPSVSTSVTQCDTPEEVQPLLKWLINDWLISFTCDWREEAQQGQVLCGTTLYTKLHSEKCRFYVSLSINTPTTNIMTEIWLTSFTKKIGIHHHHRHHPQLHQRALMLPAGEETAEGGGNLIFGKRFF